MKKYGGPLIIIIGRPRVDSNLNQSVVGNQMLWTVQCACTPYIAVVVSRLFGCLVSFLSCDNHAARVLLLAQK